MAFSTLKVGILWEHQHPPRPPIDGRHRFSEDWLLQANDMERVMDLIRQKEAHNCKIYASESTLVERAARDHVEFRFPVEIFYTEGVHRLVIFTANADRLRKSGRLNGIDRRFVDIIYEDDLTFNLCRDGEDYFRERVRASSGSATVCDIYRADIHALRRIEQDDLVVLEQRRLALQEAQGDRWGVEPN